MKEDQQTKTIVRIYILASLIAVLIWQAYLGFIAFYRVPSFLPLMNDFIESAPALTKLLFKTSNYIWIVPILGAVFVIDVIRRKKIPTLYASCVFIVMIVIGYSIYFMIYEGLFGPIWKMTNALK